MLIARITADATTPTTVGKTVGGIGAGGSGNGAVTFGTGPGGNSVGKGGIT